MRAGAVTTNAWRCGQAEPTWRSPGRACRAAGVPAKTVDDPNRHRAEHALHARTHMVDSDRLHLVVPEEPCHPGVMATLGPLVVQRSPGDGELLPLVDLAVGHVGDRDAVGPTPARVDLAIGGDRHTHPHVESLLARNRSLLGRLTALPPHPDPTRYAACSGTQAPNNPPDLRLLGLPRPLGPAQAQ